MNPPRKRVSREPIYRWTVKDFRMGKTVSGEAPSAARAKADVDTELRRVGRRLNGVQATVWRPSGGGWFCRDEGRAGGFGWEDFEAPSDA